jgi:hypothetical protein
VRNALWISGLLVLTVLPAQGNEPLTLAVTPAQSMAPATVRVRARVEPSAENRKLTIIADGDDYYRSSEFQLEGDQAPPTVELRFPSLPGGNYEIYAVLIDSAGRQRAIARRSARVLSMFSDH